SRLGLLLGARFFEERAAGPEMRERGVGCTLSFVDELDVPLQPVKNPELARDHVAVIIVEQLSRGGNAVESRFDVYVMSQRLLVAAGSERGVTVRRRTGPPRVGNRGASGNQRQHHYGDPRRAGQPNHRWPPSGSS